MSDATETPYIFSGGQQVFRQPLVLEGAALKSFVLLADQARLQAVCDAQLNQPWNEAVHYRVVSPFVQMVVMQAARAYSAAPQDAHKGWMTEVDVAYWVLLQAEPRDGGKPRLVWFLPYVFVDNALALTSGREIYGFAKELGQFSFSDAPFAMTAQTLAVEHYTPESQRRLLPVIEVSAPTSPGAAIENLGHDLAGFLELMRHGLAGDGKERVEVVVEAFQGLLKNQVGMVFLKQFPSAEVAGAACYAAVVEAPCSVRALHGLGLLPPGYRVWSADYDSHPIVRDLGVPADAAALLAMWVNFDFETGDGTVIARATI